MKHTAPVRVHLDTGVAIKTPILRTLEATSVSIPEPDRVLVQGREDLG